MTQELHEKLAAVPTQPGVYLMRGAGQEVIYVGKAVNLRNRVRSYFQQSRGHSAKVQAMVDRVADFEYIVTDSEVEALILENTLIKEHEPWYNVRLKDDKTYPFIKVTVQEAFPRIMIVRKRLRDGARYFGPYTSAMAVRETVKFLRKIFPVRTCRKEIVPGQQDRPCLNYHIGRCLGPCASLVDQTTYGEMIAEVCLALEGRHEEIIPDLHEKMNTAAEALDYERAARFRDQLQALQSIIARQKVVAQHHDDQDVLGYTRAGDLAVVQVFFVRSGKLIGRDHFLLHCSTDENGEEILAAFLKQFYSESAVIPREILLPQPLAEANVLEQWLGQLRSGRVYLRHPQRGEKRRLVEMVTENASLVLKEVRSRDERKEREIAMGLEELQEALQLPNSIRRMEAYDISNTQGNQIVASMVVLVDGKPANDEYRRFKIRTVEEGPNDYEAMKEVIHRRFLRGLKEQSGEEHSSKFSDFPDLVLIDGGKGQLNAALASRNALGIAIPFIGLAKRYEEIYMEGYSEPLILPRESQGLYMVQRIRDEAHRFAITYHRQLRGKASRVSVLDGIPGVGPKRKKTLMKHFGTVKAIRAAAVETLMAADGISRAVAEEIYQHLRKD